MISLCFTNFPIVGLDKIFFYLAVFNLTVAQCIVTVRMIYLLALLHSHVHIHYTLTLSDKVALGKEAEMTVVFKNPLPVKMSDITLNIESDELLNGKTN